LQGKKIIFTAPIASIFSKKMVEVQKVVENPKIQKILEIRCESRHSPMPSNLGEDFPIANCS
jgi:hypothetical protein